MSKTECTTQLTLFEVGTQAVTVDFEGGQVVTDAGLLAVRKLDLELGVLSGAADLMPDPRLQVRVIHSRRRLLTQRVYQALAGYFDGNESSFLRRDPLFQTLAGVSPDEDRPLASGSTANRFLHAYTRREAELPLEERPVLFEVRRAQLERITRMNESLVDLFVRTRRKRPERIVIDLDPTDDPAHGRQQLTFWHGYYDQNQSLPLLAFDGESRMPFGAWLRPGTIGTGSGTVVDALREIVPRLRAAWPDVPILVRGDQGVGGPEVYEDFYCQRGDVPERPIGELKNGLGMDRLSSPRFFANPQKMLYHVLAYALWALFREANADDPEIATIEVQTARPRLFKVGAVVKTSARRIWFHFSSTWPVRDVFRRACEAVVRFAAEIRAAAGTLFAPLAPRGNADPPAVANPPLK